VGAVASGADTQPIRGVEFVELDNLTGLGFSERFVQLCRSGFPGAGSYKGRRRTSACSRVSAGHRWRVELRHLPVPVGEVADPVVQQRGEVLGRDRAVVLLMDESRPDAAGGAEQVPMPGPGPVDLLGGRGRVPDRAVQPSDQRPAGSWAG